MAQYPAAPLGAPRADVAGDVVDAERAFGGAVGAPFDDEVVAVWAGEVALQPGPLCADVGRDAVEKLRQARVGAQRDDEVGVVDGHRPQPEGVTFEVQSVAHHATAMM